MRTCDERARTVLGEIARPHDVLDTTSPALVGGNLTRGRDGHPRVSYWEGSQISVLRYQPD